MTTNRFSMQVLVPVVVLLMAATTAFGHWLARHSAVDTSPRTAAAVAAPASAAASGAGSADELKIPAAYLAAAGIDVGPATATDVRSEMLLPALVTAAPGSEAVVTSRTAGTLARVSRRLGDTVAAGEVLATVDSPDAAAMQAERRVTQAKAEQARKTYAREQSLFDQGVTPRQALEAARADVEVAEAESQRATAVARAARLGNDGRTLAIVSPIAGRITASAAMIGAPVSPDMEIFRVAQPGAVQVQAPVTADDVRRIATGDSATVLSRSGQSVPATVRTVTPSVNAATRSATVVVVPNARQGAQTLLAGEGVQLRLRAHNDGATGGAGVAVPEDAVQNLEGRDVVFVRTEQGFRAQPVFVGVRSSGMAQIVSGLQPGQQVATRNAFLLKAESRKGGGEEE